MLHIVGSDLNEWCATLRQWTTKTVCTHILKYSGSTNLYYWTVRRFFFQFTKTKLVYAKLPYNKTFAVRLTESNSGNFTRGWYTNTCLWWQWEICTIMCKTFHVIKFTVILKYLFTLIYLQILKQMGWFKAMVRQIPLWAWRTIKGD